jgi:hypothetical protein
MGLFDAIQKTVFNICSKTFGNTASWTPLNSNIAQFATVLYKDPTKKLNFQEHDYNVERHVMEYKIGDFPGLKESADKNENNVVTIKTDDNIILSFNVGSIDKEFDGKTFVAHLNPVV